MEEKLEKRILSINNRIKELGYDLEEELVGLTEVRGDVKELFLTNKGKKFNIFLENESDIVIIHDEMQITFCLEFGEDEEEKFFEIKEVEIIKE